MSGWDDYVNWRAYLLIPSYESRAGAFAEPLRLSARAFMIRRSILDPMRRAGRERAMTTALFSGFQADVSPAGLSRR